MSHGDGRPRLVDFFAPRGRSRSPSPPSSRRGETELEPVHVGVSSHSLGKGRPAGSSGVDAYPGGEGRGSPRSHVPLTSSQDLAGADRAAGSSVGGGLGPSPSALHHHHHLLRARLSMATADTRVGAAAGAGAQARGGSSISSLARRHAEARNEGPHEQLLRLAGGGEDRSVLQTAGGLLGLPDLRRSAGKGASAPSAAADETPFEDVRDGSPAHGEEEPSQKRRKLPSGEQPMRGGGIRASGQGVVPDSGLSQHEAPKAFARTLPLAQHLYQLGTEELDSARLSALLKHRLAEGDPSSGADPEPPSKGTAPPASTIRRGPFSVASAMQEAHGAAAAQARGQAALQERLLVSAGEPGLAGGLPTAAEGTGGQLPGACSGLFRGLQVSAGGGAAHALQARREAEKVGGWDSGPALTLSQQEQPPPQQEEEGLPHAPSATLLPTAPNKPPLSAGASRPQGPGAEPHITCSGTFSCESWQPSPASPALSVQRSNAEGAGALRKRAADGTQQREREATSQLRAANSLGVGITGMGVPMVPPDPSLQHLQFLRFLQRPANPPSKWASWPPVSPAPGPPKQEGPGSGGGSQAEQRLDLALAPPAAPASDPAPADPSEERRQQHLQQLLQRYHSAPALLQKEPPYEPPAAARRLGKGAPHSDPWGATVPPQALSVLAAKASAAGYAFKPGPAAAPESPQSAFRRRPQSAQAHVPPCGELLAQGHKAGGGGAAPDASDALGKILGGLLEQLPGGLALASCGNSRRGQNAGGQEVALALLLQSQGVGSEQLGQRDALQKLLANAASSHKESGGGGGGGGGSLPSPASRLGRDEQPSVGNGSSGGQTITVLYDRQAYVYDNVTPEKAKAIVQALGVPVRTWSTAPEEFGAAAARGPGPSGDELLSYNAPPAGLAGSQQLNLAGRILTAGVAPVSSLEGLSQALSSWRKETASSSRSQGGGVGVGRMKVPRWAGGGVLPVLRTVSSLDSAAGSGGKGRGGRADGRERAKGGHRPALERKAGGSGSGASLSLEAEAGGRLQPAEPAGQEEGSSAGQKPRRPTAASGGWDGEGGAARGSALAPAQAVSRAQGARSVGPGSPGHTDADAPRLEVRGQAGSACAEGPRSPRAASSARLREAPPILDLERALVATEDSGDDAAGGIGERGDERQRAEVEREPEG